MEQLKNMSYLQLYWASQAGLVCLATTYYVLTGGFRDKTQGEKDPSEPIGLFMFRKRAGLAVFIGFVWTAWILWNAVDFFCWGTPPNDHLQQLLRTVAIPETDSTDAACTLLACTIFLVHVFMRLHDFTRVVIFSRRQALNPVSTILMYTYYIAAALSLVAEAPENTPSSCFELSSLLKWQNGVAIAVFMWATKVQLQCFKSLAKLRRNRAGHIVTTGYKIPKGHLFEYVSSPQYFAEILIYISIGLVLGFGNCTWWWLVAYVTSNQFFWAYSTQTWYKQKFADYPKDRKMLIPVLL